MKKFWGPFFGFLLLPALYSLQRPSERVETALPPVNDSISRQEREPGGTILHFPDYVDGGGWSVQLVITNVDAEATAEVRVDVYDPDRQPVLDLFESDLALEIPSLGSRIWKSAGSGAIRRGWIEVETDSAAVSGLLTYRHGESGVEVGVKPVELGPQFALFVEESPTVGSGIAVFKPDASLRLELRIRDEDGDDPLEGGFVPWGSFHQRARTLPEWFTADGVDTGFLTDFHGLLFLETEDASPFAPLGLRFGKGTSSLSAVPAIRTQSEEPQETGLVFPDYVDGGGWAVQLVLSNVDPDVADDVRVKVYDPDGRPVRDLFDSDLTLEIPALGSRVWRSAGVGAIRRGWIQVETDSAAVSGLLTYRHVQTGIEVSVEPAQLGKEFALFVEESGTVGAGLALFKPDTHSRIELRLRDEEGTDPLDGVYVPWRDFHQAARTLPEWFDVPGVDTEFLADYRGLLFLRTEDESGFAPLGLRFGKKTSSLSAVPAIRIPDGGGIDGGQAPPPTVMLSASPTSIDRGQNVTLTWSSTNAESAEISPDIGMVPTGGSQTVTPNVTTTYRITVTGTDGQTATASVTVTVTVSERVALGMLFDALGGSGWTRSENWLTDAPLGEWYGIEVDSQGRVIGLRMAEWVDTEDGGQEKVGNELTGSIPPELGSLTHLRVLDLGMNQLSGLIPPELGALTSLTFLDLSHNSFTGPIPPELGRLTNLRTLRLGRNVLTGPIPTQLGNLDSLLELDLGGNDLTGPIPPELGRLTNLWILLLGGGGLSGPIPPELGGLDKVWYLGLSNNNLSGPIPPELGNMASLQVLDLYGNDLSGPIPAELGKLSTLESLQLFDNQLSGSIPLGLVQLRRLRTFIYSNNVGLCAPGTSDFVAWLKGVERHEGAYCNESDVAALNAIYRNIGGEDWTNSNGWLGESAVSEWYGVQADSLGRVTGLDLSDNGLKGRLPRILGQLAELTELRIDSNPLSGRLPLELARLSLQVFHYADTELCAPIEESFQAWLNAISTHEGSGGECAPLTDRDILVALYEATDGPTWFESENWHTDAPLEEWRGVTIDVEGRVSVLWLGDNNLQGPIPPELGNLSNLRRVYLSGNQFTGVIPPELGSLAKLTWLWLSNNDLTGPIPPEIGDLANLEDLNLFDNNLSGAIPPELDALENLTDLSLSSNKLSGPIPPELGNLAGLKQLFIGDNPLTGSIPPELGNLSNLERLSIRGTRVSESIPPELGNLESLEYMWLNGNELTGSIPPKLGALDNLGYLYLSSNNLTGSVPKELANLDNLKHLYLSDNSLSGTIPPELGNLPSVTHLALDGNALSGQVSGAFGKLSTLEELTLSNNELTGSVPPEFGGMSSLKQLVLTNNPGMKGTLPLRLAELRRLEGLLAGGTDLCAPSNLRFQTWMRSVPKRRVSHCVEGEPPIAYLTQAVQSRKFPVPLVAGEKALLRVFPTAGQATSQRIPAVRASFYVDGREMHVEDIPGKNAPVPTQVNEGNLSIAAHAEIPAGVIQPGLEMVIEVNPEGMLDPVLRVKQRIPEEGRLAVDVRTMPLFDLTLIPFLWSQDPDSSIVDLVEAIAVDAEGHEMLWHTRTLLPIGELEVTAHEPVVSTSNNAFDLRANAQAIRAVEGGTGYYMGLMPHPVTGAAGVGFIGTRVSFSIPNAPTIAHELGHNLSLYHAPCGGAGGPDPSFPETDGSIGAWGYDFREGGQLVTPTRPDLMTYCGPYWISDYHFTNALRYRLHTAGGGGQSALLAAPLKSLLLWGGIGHGGAPFLEPAFVIEAPASLPSSTGQYEIIGRTPGGNELFSLLFHMPETADGDGRSSFAFVLPVLAAWADQLASITLSGPGGSVTVDQETDRPVTMLRNPRTGQVRAVLRGAEAAPPNVDATVSAMSLDPGLERLTSHGLPEPEDWNR